MKNRRGIVQRIRTAAFQQHQAMSHLRTLHKIARAPEIEEGERLGLEDHVAALEAERELLATLDAKHKRDRSAGRRR